jgi:hypothetical protein
MQQEKWNKKTPNLKTRPAAYLQKQVETLGSGSRVAIPGQRGDCYDNAAAESFFSNLKNKLVHQCDFASREAARAAIFDYIEVFYNRQRRRQALGYLSPVQFEQ